MPNQKFALFDIDGTLFRNSLYFEVVNKLINMGSIQRDIAQQINDAYTKWKFYRDDVSFWHYCETLMSLHESQLSTIKIDDYNLAVDYVFDTHKDNVYAYTKGLINSLKEKDYLLFAISGSQQEIIDKFCKYHGFDDYIGSVHEKNSFGTAFTGKASQIHKDKTDQLNSLVAKHDVSFKDSVGIGDSHGDIKTLEMVEIPVAFNPNSRLYEYAKSKGWKIVIERKDIAITLKYIDGRYFLVS